jgi:hypothetical protein
MMLHFPRTAFPSPSSHRRLEARRHKNNQSRLPCTARGLGGEQRCSTVVVYGVERAAVFRASCWRRRDARVERWERARARRTRGQARDTVIYARYPASEGGGRGRRGGDGKSETNQVVDSLHRSAPCRGSRRRRRSDRRSDTSSSSRLHSEAPSCTVARGRDRSRRSPEGRRFKPRARDRRCTTSFPAGSK